MSQSRWSEVGGCGLTAVGEADCWWVGPTAGGWGRLLVGGADCWWVGPTAGGWG